MVPGWRNNQIEVPTLQSTYMILEPDKLVCIYARNAQPQILDPDVEGERDKRLRALSPPRVHTPGYVGGV